MSDPTTSDSTDSGAPSRAETAVAAALADRAAMPAATPPPLAQLHAAAQQPQTSDRADLSRPRSTPDTSAPGGSARSGSSRPWSTRRVLAAAGVAAVIAGGVTATVWSPSWSGSGPATTAAGPGGAVRPAPTAVDARALLTRIATMAERTPLTPPRTDQWEYTKTETPTVQVLTPNELNGPMRLTGQTSVSELWQPQDPTRDPLVHSSGPGAVLPDGTVEPPYNGTIRQPMMPEGEAAPPRPLSTYAEFAALPTDDPPALLAQIQRGLKTPQPGSSTPASSAISNISAILDGRLLPPQVAAALYHALADTPGVTAEDGVTDFAGRPGVAVGATDLEGEHSDIIFDPAALVPIGLRSYMVTDGRKGKAGQPTGATAFLAQGFVDQAGEIPTG